MFRTLQLIKTCATLKPSLGFQAIQNKQLQLQVEKHSSPKLDALVSVILSLNNTESEYLNLLLTEQAIQSNKSILASKLINSAGYKLQPIQYFYQQAWIKEEWKDTELLQFILSDQKEQAVQAEEVEAIKTHYDVELTSLDPSQKIRIIKNLREIFTLGLKEAKDYADKVPSMITKNMKREEAEKLKADLEAVGCVITLK